MGATNEPKPSQHSESDPVENIYYGDELINSTGHKNRGRGRPMNTSQKQITPKIPRKDAKNYDEKELKELRKRRKIELNNLATQRHREKKKEEKEAREAEKTRLEERNRQLKQKESELLEEIGVWKIKCSRENIDIAHVKTLC